MKILESYTVIRVGVPDAPYVVGVLRDGDSLETGRLDVPAGTTLDIGASVTRVEHDGDYPLFIVDRAE